MIIATAEIFSLHYIVENIYLPGMDEMRSAVRAAYLGLRELYPALPEQLRDFQV